MNSFTLNSDKQNINKTENDLFNSSIDVLSKEIDGKPFLADQYFTRAKALYYIDEYANSLKDLLEYKKIKKTITNPEFYYFLGINYYKLGKFNNAKEAFSNTNLDYYPALVLNYKGLCNLKLKKYNSALNDFELALNVYECSDKLESELYYNSAEIYFIKKEYHTCIQYCNLSSKAFPNNPIPHLLLAKCYHLILQEEKTIKHLKTAINLGDIETEKCIKTLFTSSILDKTKKEINKQKKQSINAIKQMMQKEYSEEYTHYRFVIFPKHIIYSLFLFSFILGAFYQLYSVCIISFIWFSIVALNHRFNLKLVLKRLKLY